MKNCVLATCFLCVVASSSVFAQNVTDEKALPYLHQGTLLIRDDSKKGEAIAAFEKAMEYTLSPKNESIARACLANLYHDTDKDKAFEFLKRARELDPTNTNVLAPLGSAYAQRREYGAARECLREYLKGHPDGQAAPSVNRLLTQIDQIEAEGALLDQINKAVTLYNEKRYTEAIAILESTQKGGEHAHKDKEQEILGLCYVREGKYKPAIECFKAVLAADPKKPAIVSALAGAYEGMGDLKQARECLKQYVHMDSKGDMATAAKDRLPVLKKVMKTAGDIESSDYFQAVSKPCVKRWSLTRMPLKVYFEPADSVKNYDKAFEGAVPKALDLWCKATDGKVSWTTTTDRTESNIEVVYTDDPAAVSRTQSHSEAGVCEMKASGQKGAKIAGINHAVIKLLTTNDNGKAFTAAELEATSAHEVGHALGISGHSANPNDVMFFAATKNVKDGLTTRDANTLRCIYDAVIYDTGKIEVPGRSEPEKHD